MTTTAQPTAAAQLSLFLDQLANLEKAYDTSNNLGRAGDAAERGGAYIETTKRLLALLQPRDVSGEEVSGIAVTLMGVDVYVQDYGTQLAVAANGDDAAKPVVMESFDGASWEHPLKS